MMTSERKITGRKQVLTLADQLRTLAYQLLTVADAQAHVDPSDLTKTVARKIRERLLCDRTGLTTDQLRGKVGRGEFQLGVHFIIDPDGTKWWIEEKVMEWVESCQQPDTQASNTVPAAKSESVSSSKESGCPSQYQFQQRLQDFEKRRESGNRSTSLAAQG